MQIGGWVGFDADIEMHCVAGEAEYVDRKLIRTAPFELRIQQTRSGHSVRAELDETLHLCLLHSSL